MPANPSKPGFKQNVPARHPFLWQQVFFEGAWRFKMQPTAQSQRWQAPLARL